jgi:hypothetical protein
MNRDERAPRCGGTQGADETDGSSVLPRRLQALVSKAVASGADAARELKPLRTPAGDRSLLVLAPPDVGRRLIVAQKLLLTAFRDLRDARDLLRRVEPESVNLCRSV